MRINNNIQALNAYNNLSKNQFKTSRNLEKLSSGLRINRASDDAAGLAISEKMRGQIRGLSMAEKNALDGISVIQTAEGALSSVHAMLQRMRELAVQAANDTYTTSDRTEIQEEINQLLASIDDAAQNTEFNTKKLLDGSFATSGTALQLQIGANAGQKIAVTIGEMGTSGLSLTGLSVLNHDDASTAIDTVNTAIEAVSSLRSKLGALQNRLEHTMNNLATARENLTAAESRIRDADMALEMTDFTRNNIINQAATAMLAQANQLPQGVLQLLQ
ncbi:flagellin [Desulfuribacillus stibiiarsenatis]|uniref:Flagellin n=1 Tax=Desulfuribacillus stibiiarsenatis TaxID=1390249 RepID=A0A1E5L9I8_9FIRM|nr:flagellin [Desulfuribacillus stibiiarsenatis]OEH86791.1 flagellin [Desulfuribacillus stibiiarsenatis]